MRLSTATAATTTTKVWSQTLVTREKERKGGRGDAKVVEPAQRSADTAAALFLKANCPGRSGLCLRWQLNHRPTLGLVTAAT